MWAANAKRSHDWDIGAKLWVALLEPHRDRTKQPTPFHESEIHPYMKARKAAPDMMIDFKDFRAICKASGIKGA